MVLTRPSSRTLQKIMQIGFEAWIKLVDWVQPLGLEGCKFYLVPIEARKEADTRGWCSLQSSSAGWELETRVFSAFWESEHQLNKKSWSPEIIFFKPVRLQKVIFFTTAPKNIPKLNDKILTILRHVSAPPVLLKQKTRTLYEKYLFF